jgi:hypothetical protein
MGSLTQMQNGHYFRITNPRDTKYPILCKKHISYNEKMN